MDAKVTAQLVNNTQNREFVIEDNENVITDDFSIEQSIYDDKDC